MQVQKQEILSWDNLTHFQEQDWVGPSSPLVSPRLALYGLLLLTVWRAADAPSTRRTHNSTLYLPLAKQ